MLGNIFITVAVVSHGGVDVGVALDIVDNLLFEYGLQHHCSGTVFLKLAQVVNVGGEAAASCQYGAVQLQSEIFDFCIHNLFNICSILCIKIQFAKIYKKCN